LNELTPGSEETKKTVRVAALLPVYNEAAHLRGVLERLKRQRLHVLVVDDGSTDGSSEIAVQSRVETLALGENYGKGYALRKGFEALCGRSFDWVLILDADGQHLPEEIPSFIAAAETGRYDFINGNRLGKSGNMPPVRYWTNRVMSGMISLLVGQKVRDVQCGFKMFSAQYVKRARLMADRFEIEDDLVLEAGRLGFRIGHVPVSTVYGKEVSKIRPVRDTLRFIGFIMKWIWRVRVVEGLKRKR